jgi:hypothetical protein
MNGILALAGGVLSGAAVGALVIFLLTVIKTRRKAEGPYRTSFIYSGNLKQTSLVDAMQLLEIGKREGILHVYHGRRKGYIAFAQGMVIDAFYRNATGREAIFAMMQLPEGDFYFESKEVKSPRLITDSVMDLVMMSMSQQQGGQSDSQWQMTV